MTLTSPASAWANPKVTTAATRSMFRFFVEIFIFTPPRLEVETGLNDQRVRVGLKTLWIVRAVEAVGIVTRSAIAIHKVALHLDVCESVQIEARGDDFFVDVARLLAAGTEFRRHVQPVAGVVRTELKP